MQQTTLEILIRTALITYNQKSLNAEYRDNLRDMFGRIFTGGILADECESKESDSRSLTR